MTHLLARLEASTFDDPALEAVLWETLVEHGSTEDVADAVLVRLEPRGDRLLTVDPGARSAIERRLRAEAWTLLETECADPGELSEVRDHPLQLPEVAFARTGRPAAAAALWALLHDRLAVGQGEGSADPLVRVGFRYKIGVALGDDAAARRAARHGERSLRVMELALEGARPDASITDPASREVLRQLRFHIQVWLGLHHARHRATDAAVAAYRGASRDATEATLQVCMETRAARLLAARGDASRALELLLSVEGRLPQVHDPDVQEQWTLLHRQLAATEGEAAG